jgi:hypothetical protein
MRQHRIVATVERAKVRRHKGHGEHEAHQESSWNSQTKIEEQRIFLACLVLLRVLHLLRVRCDAERPCGRTRTTRQARVRR